MFKNMRPPQKQTKEIKKTARERKRWNETLKLIDDLLIARSEIEVIKNAFVCEIKSLKKNGHKTFPFFCLFFSLFVRLHIINFIFEKKKKKLCFNKCFAFAFDA